MSTLTTVLAILGALEHLYILFLETIATSSESTSRVFDITLTELPVGKRKQYDKEGNELNRGRME